MTTLEIPPDGLGGTDNVAALFPGRPSAAPLPVQEDVVRLITVLYSLAQEGKLTGLCVIGFDEFSKGSHSLVGKCPYAMTLGVLEDMKFSMLMQNLGQGLRGE